MTSLAILNETSKLLEPFRIVYTGRFYGTQITVNSGTYSNSCLNSRRPPVTTTRVGRTWVLVFFLIPAMSGAVNAVSPGVVNLQSADLVHGDPVALDGEWRWYPGELLTEVPRAGVSRDGRMGAPGYLNLPLSLAPEKSRGYGTLAITIIPPAVPGLYGVKIPYLASANRVYVDGVELGGAGSVARPYHPQYLPLELFFSASGKPIELVIQVANEHHRRMRLSRVYFGRAEQISHFTHLRLIFDAVLLGSLLLLALYHLLAFFLHRRDRALLHFAAIALLAAFRLGIARERILVRLWTEMPAEVMMKLGYAPVFLLLPLLVLYLHALSPYDTLRRIARAARWVGALFLGLILIAPVRVYDWAFAYGLGIIMLMAVYVILTVVRKRVFESTQGAVVIVLGGFFVMVAAVSDYLRELDAYSAPELLSSAIVFFLLLQAYFLAWRFRTAYNSTSTLAAEVQHLNEDLEERILERTRELARANAQLRKISRTDGLTGLANRRTLDETIEREWLVAARRRVPLAAIMIDIDHFKMFNDSLGHTAGDRCLREIGTIMQNGVHRPGDLVARYGGEEFAVLLPDTDTEAAVTIADFIRRAVEERKIPHPSSPAGTVVTISLGVAAIVPDASTEPDALIDRADRALYDAKAAGRNRVATA